MINVSTYWTLPPALQGRVRKNVYKFEQDLQRIVGHYVIEDEYFDPATGEGCIEFSLLCSKCYNVEKWTLCSGYSPITQGEYLDPKHEMHGEKCEKCNKPLA